MFKLYLFYIIIYIEIIKNILKYFQFKWKKYGWPNSLSADCSNEFIVGSADTGSWWAGPERETGRRRDLEIGNRRQLESGPGKTGRTMGFAGSPFILLQVKSSRPCTGAYLRVRKVPAVRAPAKGSSHHVSFRFSSSRLTTRPGSTLSNFTSP